MSLCIRTISNKFPPFVNTRKHVSKIDHRIPKHFLNTPTTTSTVTNFRDKQLELYIADSTYRNLVFPSLIAAKESTRRSAKRYTNDKCVHFQRREIAHIENVSGFSSRTKDNKDGEYKMENYLDRQKISLGHSSFSNETLANNTINFSKLCDDTRAELNFAKNGILMANETNVESMDESRTPDKDSNNKSHANLEKVFSQLSHDLPKLFVSQQNYSIYTEDIMFVNNIKGVMTQGLFAYVRQIMFLKLYGYLRYAYVRLDILKMTLHPEDNTIKVRWCIKGVSTLKSLFLLFKLRSPSIDKAVASQEAWYDGFSTFYVNDDGKVFKHVIDKVIPDQDVIQKDDPKVPIHTKLASFCVRLFSVHTFNSEISLKSKI